MVMNAQAEDLIVDLTDARGPIIVLVIFAVVNTVSRAKNSLKTLSFDKSVISDVIQTQFKQDNPDLIFIEDVIRKSTGLSSESARSLIYQISRKVNQRLFPPITGMELILTKRCNLSCAYCFEKNWLGFKQMPVETALRAVDMLFDYSGRKRNLLITFFGGEPTLNLQLIQKIISYIKIKQGISRKNVEYHMTSNGILFNEPLAKYFGENKIRVLLSIDGLQKTHDKFRIDKQGRGTFKKVITAMRILKKYQPWMGAKMTVMPENAGFLFEDVRGLFDFGINQFIIGPASGIEWNKNALINLKDNFERISDWYRKARRKRDQIRILQEEKKPDKTPRFGCQAGRNSICIDINGDISPCAKVLSLDSVKAPCKLGNVSYGLTHIANRRELVYCFLLKENSKKMFNNDKYLSNCFAENFQFTGNIFCPSLSQQELRKIEIAFSESLNR